MSASRKKQLRKENNAAHLTKKQQEAKKEAKKLVAYTVTFWIILALCASIVLGMVLEAPINVAIDRTATAVVVGDHKITTTELTYFYIDAINNWYSQYGSYASYIGLNTSKGLDQQFYDEDTGTTWADYFVDQAISSAKNVYALYDAAKAAGYSLSDKDQSSVDALYENLKTQAKNSNMSVSKYLQTIYGDCANEKTYKTYYEVTVLASAYYSDYAAKLKDTYTDAGLRDFEKDEPYKYNSYSYLSFYLSLDTFKIGGTKDDKGNITYTEAEIAAAKAYLEQVKTDLSNPDINTLELLNAAIAKMEDDLEAKKAEAEKSDTTTTDSSTESKTTTGDTTTDDTTTGDTTTGDTTTGDTTTEDKTEGDKTEGDKTEGNKNEGNSTTTDKKHSTATENKKVLYSSISTVMQEWLRDSARKNGDITALAYESTTTDKDGKEVKELKGYYIVLFQESHDNNYALANVRHILIAFEGGTYNSSTGQTTYSDAEKKAAKDKAEKLLKEWKDGEATEESFAALANKHSADGDGTTGGLYEDVYPGQMVTNFNDWCFDESRKTGDTGVVESTYGYHVMFYVGDSETIYRDYMVTNDKLTEEMDAWQEALLKDVVVEEKNLKRIDKDLILSSGSSSTTTTHDGHDH